MRSAIPPARSTRSGNLGYAGLLGLGMRLVGRMSGLVARFWPGGGFVAALLPGDRS